MPESDEDRIRNRYPIERRRLGKINYINDDGSYGFIEAEDFRDDVFFHNKDWEGGESGEGQSPIQPEVAMWVEFELDDAFFDREQRLRAKAVRPTDRPRGRKLSGRDATFQVVTHHPKARRKRPTWRK